MSTHRTHLRLLPKSEPENPADGPIDLEQAFRRFAPLIAGVGFRILGRSHELDDVVQEVFLHATRAIRQLRKPDALQAWLVAIAVRVARRRLKLRRLRSFVGLDEMRDYEEVADAHATAEERAVVASLYRALDRIPVEHRLAWTLRHMEGEQLEQVALLCGCSLATAKRRIAAAQQAISKAVAPWQI